MRSKIVLVVFLIIVVIAVAAYVCSEAMRVHEVVVLGCVEQAPERVVELAQITNEESMFQIKPKEVAQRVSADPYFETESVRCFHLFGRVRITVSEHLASAMLVYNGAVYVLDEEGLVLEKNLEIGSRSLPVVEGMVGISEPTVGEKLFAGQETTENGEVETDSRRTAAMSAILIQLREQNVLQLIETIDVSEVSDLKMTTVSGFTVDLGNFDEMESKVRWLAAVEPILVSEGYTGGIITVSTGDNASFLPESYGEDGTEEMEE